MIRCAWLLAVAVGMLICREAIASITLFAHDERGDWEILVGAWDEMTFEGFEPGTTVTDEYFDAFGVTFIDGMNQTSENAIALDGFAISYPNFGGELELALETPRFAGGLVHPGTAWVELWSGETLIDEFVYFSPAVEFVGWISDTPFDRVVVHDGADIVFVDDIILAMPVPAPGAMALLVISMSTGRRRRGRG